MKMKGFSLMELIIALFITSLLLSLVSEELWFNKFQFKKIMNLLEERLDLSLAEHLMKRSIRNAGYTACLGIETLNSYDSRTGKENLKAVEIQTGRLIIQHMDSNFIEVERIENQNKILIKNKKFVLKPERPLILVDCYQAEIHQIGQIQKASEGLMIILKKPLRFNFDKPFYLAHWLEENYFIQKNKFHEKALFYKLDKAEELSKNIKNVKAKMIKKTNRTAIEISLQSKNSTPLSFTTLVRTPQ